MDAQLTVTSLDPLALIAGDGELASSTKEKYTKILGRYLDTGASIGDAGALGAYAKGLPASQRALLRAAVAKWGRRMTTMIKGQATPANEAAVTASIYRLDALSAAIEVQQPKGRKIHTWLSPSQVKAMYDATDGGIGGARDRAALGLLVAAGLRREEAVKMTFDAIKYLPVKERMRAALQVTGGKGAKSRVIPISDDLANQLDEWGRHVGHTGRIIRSLGRKGEIGQSMSAVALFKLVGRYGRRIGKPGLAAHDLRRTFAELGRMNGVPITQLSVLLGHENVATTMRYLNLDLDLEATASDFVPWG